MTFEDALKDACQSSNRLQLVSQMLNALEARSVCELGVWEGEFSEHVLRQVASVETYYMLDPWRHLDDWNKPFNVSMERFEEVFSKAVHCTDFASDRRRVLRGTTSEVIDEIPDSSLDAAYIDADHTFRGITIDFVSIFPKLRDGGLLLGDDCFESIWQHGADYEPTGVFPMVLYLAEAFQCELYLLPHHQFIVRKVGRKFKVANLSGKSYANTNLLDQLKSRV